MDLRYAVVLIYGLLWLCTAGLQLLSRRLAVSNSSASVAHPSVADAILCYAMLKRQD